MWSRRVVLLTIVGLTLAVGAERQVSYASDHPHENLRQQAEAQDDLISPHPRGYRANAGEVARSKAMGSAGTSVSPVLSWQVETVDSGGDVGEYASLAVDHEGRVHISYHSAIDRKLLYAYGGASNWTTATVDTASGSTGEYTSLALDSNGYPCISYRRTTTDFPIPRPVTRLRYACYDGQEWSIDTIEEVGNGGGESSLAFDSGGRPHVAYYEAGAGALKVATLNGSEWVSETVNDHGSVVGKGPSLVLDDRDSLHISYIDVTSNSLKYAQRVGGAWQTETVDDDRQVEGVTSLRLDSEGVPHISYYGVQCEGVWYAVAEAPGDWTSVEVAGAEGGIAYNSMDLDANNNPHISYFNPESGVLSYVFFTGADWVLETVDDTGAVGTYASLALDASGQPHIAYYDETNGDLKHASDVPLRYQRRAAQLVAEMRGTDMAPGWEMAQLGPGVERMYRPDVPGVAYYEFPVVAPETVTRSHSLVLSPAPWGAVNDPLVGLPMSPSRSRWGRRAGFVIISTGDHDFPIPHWDFTGDPLSARLAGAAHDLDQFAERFYKLDALTYVAEDGEGALSAQLGALPPKISGMDPAWLDTPPPSFETIWSPGAQADNDQDTGGISGTEFISGTLTPPPSLERTAWESWSDLKLGYSETYSIPLELLRREADAAWEVDALMQEGGPMRKGDVRILAMPWPTPTVSLSGDAVERGYTHWSVVATAPGLPPNLHVEAIDSALGETVPFTVTIQYPNGAQECFGFTIVEPYEVFLPLTLCQSDGVFRSVLNASFGGHQPEIVKPQATRGWTDWDYVWAGGDATPDHAEQRWYLQIRSGDLPNTSDCWSGCGATAWAMLFGWADNQAALGDNPYWDGRWGLYRENGGYGADAVAPPYMDAGVENVTWEIRNYIDTWCNAINDNGATWASDMRKAEEYVENRSYVRVFASGNDVSDHRFGKYRRKAKAAIKYRGPAIIGIGLWEHYPLAYGFKKRQYRTWGTTWYTQRKFYVNLGWGDQTERGWVSAYPIWFAGEIRPSVPLETNEVDDLALHRPSDHKWYYDFGGDGDTDDLSGAWGKEAGDLPLAGDFDRDGFHDDTLIFRVEGGNGRWHYNYDHDGDTDEQSGPWGWDGDLPLVGDFDRDGFVDDVAVYRPSTHLWYYDYEHNGTTDASDGPWGWAGDQPFAGDFDRDGYVDDVAVFRPSTQVVYYDHDHDGTTDEQVGHWTTESGLPVAGDFDRDGHLDDVAFFIHDWEPVSLWVFDYDHNGSLNDVVDWGFEGALPVAGAFGENEDPGGP